MSHKFQITLPDDLASELRQEAAQLGVPLAEFIRQAMRERLRQSRSRSQGNKRPLAAIVGIVKSDETDLAARVDEILYR
jgi:metal-responsive CopG/Arc/MetJ family transcriptional regulator